MKRLSGSIFLASLIQLQRPSDTFAMCVDFIHQFRSPNQHTDPIQHERHLDVPRDGGSTNGVPILAVLRSLVVSPPGASFGKLGKSRSRVSFAISKLQRRRIGASPSERCANLSHDRDRERQWSRLHLFWHQPQTTSLTNYFVVGRACLGKAMVV